MMSDFSFTYSNIPGPDEQDERGPWQECCQTESSQSAEAKEAIRKPIRKFEISEL